MEITGDDFSNFVPPVPLTPEGWDLWTVQNVLMMVCSFLAGPGNSDRAVWGDSLDGATQKILNEPWKLTSSLKEDKTTVVRVAMSMTPREATWTIRALGELLGNLERRKLTWSDLLAMTGTRIVTNTTKAATAAIKLPLVAVSQAVKQADQETGSTSSWVIGAAGLVAAGVGLIYLGPIVLPLVSPLLRRIK